MKDQATYMKRTPHLETEARFVVSALLPTTTRSCIYPSVSFLVIKKGIGCKLKTCLVLTRYEAILNLKLYSQAVIWPGIKMRKGKNSLLLFSGYCFLSR